MRQFQCVILVCTFICSISISASPIEQSVNARTPEQQQRDQYRHPAETLKFFKIQSGMVVAEALPGRGWYSEIIAPVLGPSGTIHGINYNDDMWALFGFFSPEAIKKNQQQTALFPTMVANYGQHMPTATGFTFGTTPKSLAGTVDRVLFIRALHNLHRFEAEAGTLTQALSVAYSLLKDDGLVGVVQHRAGEHKSDKWADGSMGYLKTSQVIDAFRQAGFVLIDSTEINANPKDKPGKNDMVWRLPPTYFGLDNDPQKIKAANAIGESDRMTLLFAKAN